MRKEEWGTVGIPIRLKKELRELEKGLVGMKKGFPTLLEYLLKLAKSYGKLKKEYYTIKNKLDLLGNDK